MNIQLNKENPDQHIVTITGPVTAIDIEKVMTDLVDESGQPIKFMLKSSNASDYLIIQLLAILRKEQKSISVEWVDHKPSITILSIIESVLR